MKSEEIAVILKSFDAPDEVRVMQKGKFERVHLGGITIGRATYEPGWKWSEHVGVRVLARRVVPLNMSASFSQEPRQ